MTYPLPRTSRGVQPREVVSPRPGDRGWPVYAIQKALDELRGYALAKDGVFGISATDGGETGRVIGKFQHDHGLTADGLPGPMTQRKLAELHVAKHDTGLPAGLMDGFAAMEGGWLLAAVNDSTPGGIDCGLIQRRVYQADYDSAAVIGRAFNTGHQLALLNGSLENLHGIFAARAGTRDGSLPVDEKAWRLAALNHNYPSAADRLSRTPLAQISSYWTTPQSWVTAVGYHFPDGAPVRTPLEWCHLYAGVLGHGVHGTSGNITGGVTSWAV